MKLYYAPGACSLADHIALLEAGVEFELERVDLRGKVTEKGANFLTINPKGYVPALVLDSGEIVTENVAVLDWIATQHPALGLPGPMGRTRLLEALTYISTEIHKGFKPFFTGAGEEDRAQAERSLVNRLHWLADRKVGKYLFGNEPTVADFYLFVTLRWAMKFNIVLPEVLVALKMRMAGRPYVQLAVEFEEAPTRRMASAG
ncbi:MAG TPA: glutathione S-transferase N-terminal domain-containing protein [Povalibacter sp.]|nr:glutathione S-transferase N-terminal domain-containing protein [Povalibacter sp.]